MATVTGLTAERMLQLALEWENVQGQQSELTGVVNQLAVSLGNVANIQLDLVNIQIPNLDQDLADAQVTLNDLNQNQLPNLVLDLANANLLIDDALSQASDLQTQLDGLNSDTLPGLSVALGDLETELVANIDGRFPIGSTQISDSAITTDKLAANSVTALKILANNILAGHILAGEIQTNHMAANSINADRLLANTIIGDKIAANTISANKLLVQGENLLTDPGFESGSLSYHSVSSDSSWVAENVGGTAARSGSRYLRYTLIGTSIPANTTALRTGGSITNVTTTHHPRVSPGDVVRVGFWINATSTTTAQARIQIFVRAVADPNTNVVSLTGSYENLGVAGWKFVTGELAVPAGASDPNLYVVGGLQFQNGSLGDIIRVDDMVIRLRLDGSLIVDGTITTNHIVATGISAAVITTGTMHADRITSNTFTGAQFTATVSITSKKITGGEIVGTKFKTADTGTRLEINDDEEAGSIKGRIDDGAVTAPVLINPKILGTGGARRQVLYLSSGSLGGGVGRLEVRSGSADNTTWAPVVNVDAELHTQQVLKAFGNIKLEPSQTVVYEGYVGGGVTGASVNNSGAFIRTGSNRALKKNIIPLTIPQAQKVLSMEPVSFQWKDEKNMGRAFQAGFIAEQADEVGAELWVTRDRDGAPSGVRYPEITAAHNILIKNLLERITALEKKVK